MRGLVLALILALAGCCTTQPNDRSMANMPFDKLIKELAKPIE